MARILLVSDDRENRKTSAEILRIYIDDCHVTFASSLREMAAERRAEGFDVVIFDGMGRVGSDEAEKLFHGHEKQKVLIVSFDEENKRQKTPFLNRIDYAELPNMVDHLIKTPYEVLIKAIG